MAQIQLPEILAKVTKLPAKTFQVEGDTVAEAVKHLCREHDVLEAHLFYDNGQFKDHFLFTIDGELVTADTPMVPGSSLDILLATSGGLDTPDAPLSKDEVERYARHISLPEVGRQGQQRLRNSRVLIIGTGGLGSPVSLYLAAAGVGTLGLVDFDVVESSNLQRQVVHSESTIGLSKVESARRRLLDVNNTIRVETHETALTADNAMALIGDYDLVIDGSDNFSTRYLVNDACVLQGKPLVYGAIYQFDGQASVFGYQGGPCYRCLFPTTPPASLAPNCSAGGVIGVLPGMIGMIQATEALKLLLELGQSLSGRLLRYDARAMSFGEVRFGKRADCPVCTADPRHYQLSDSPQACASTPAPAVSLAPEYYIQPARLAELLADASQPPLVVDVREPNELEICRLEHCHNIPLADLDEHLDDLPDSAPIYLLCLGGGRAEQAANRLRQQGLEQVYVIEGGLKRWARDVDPTLAMY